MTHRPAQAPISETGTAIIMGKKGRRVWTPGGDEQALGQGVLDAYEKNNLRYSQLAPISMFEERNTRTNLPAQIDISEEGEDAYKLQFMAKGGGSANKTFLFQETKALLNPASLIGVLDAATKSLTADPQMADINNLKDLAKDQDLSRYIL